MTTKAGTTTLHQWDPTFCIVLKQLLASRSSSKAPLAEAIQTSRHPCSSPTSSTAAQLRISVPPRVAVAKVAGVCKEKLQNAWQPAVSYSQSTATLAKCRARQVQGSPSAGHAFKAKKHGRKKCGQLSCRKQAAALKKGPPSLRAAT